MSVGVVTVRPKRIKHEISALACFLLTLGYPIGKRSRPQTGLLSADSDRAQRLWTGVLTAEDKSPVHGALRELLEETGLAPDRVRHLGAFGQIPAVETGRVHMYLVDCSLAKRAVLNLDATEDLSTLLVPISKLGSIIENGDMDCLACVAATYKLLLLQGESDGVIQASASLT
jgi:ADP-ribose pyrophosphatase YjhB (NUDIX family)